MRAKMEGDRRIFLDAMAQINQAMILGVDKNTYVEPMIGRDSCRVLGTKDSVWVSRVVLEWVRARVAQKKTIVESHCLRKRRSGFELPEDGNVE